MRLSITMAYYNRPRLLENTLWSIFHATSTIDDFEVVIVDDVSSSEKAAKNVTQQFSDKMDIKVFERKRKKGVNPCIPINASVLKSSGDIIIICNPENLHLTPIVNQIAAKFLYGDSRYIIGTCYSISKENQNLINSIDFSKKESLSDLRKIERKNKSVTFDGDDGWYCHPVYRPAPYYFMAAMLREDFMEMGGLDEDYDLGNGYEDDDFTSRLQKKGIPFEFAYDILSLHQNHYKHVGLRMQPGGTQNNQLLFQRKVSDPKWRVNEGRKWGRL